MNSVMEFMAADHDRLDSIFAEFRIMKNTNMASAKTLFDDFIKGLQRHITWEEDILFPVFEDRTGMYDAGPVAVMQMEHCHIKNYLEQIQNRILAKEINGIDELVCGLMELLADHNAKEESILYPWIDRETSDKEREDIISRMKNSSME